MPKNVVDAYLAATPEPHRATLAALRKTIRAALPGCEECITYNIPTFKVAGSSIAGFAAYKDHCSYFPMSGSVLGELEAEVAKYETSRGTLRFAKDKPLPAGLVRKLIKTRLRDVAARAARKR